MSANTATLERSAPDAFRFYRQALKLMQDSELSFLLGGAYAFGYYTRISRHTKDLDVFVRPAHVRSALGAFAAAGYRTELVFAHWLAKVYHGDDFVDIIFKSGNGLCPVDEAWFEHAVRGEVFGVAVPLIPAEEMIWQKAFIMERERFDGADVNHLLRARGRQLDWDRLLARFGDHWRVLLSHLILFGFVYPDEKDMIPEEVLHSLTRRLREEPGGDQERLLCQGTLLSRMQYLADTEEWGYTDPRLALGTMTEEQLIRWTDAGR